MLFHIADHLPDLVFLLRSAVLCRSFFAEQAVAQAAEKFIQIIDRLAGS